MPITNPDPILSRWQLLFFRIPVIGWIARDVMFGDKNNFWAALIALISLWMSSALTFGLPGLYLPALALVPVVFGLLLLVTKG